MHRRGRPQEDLYMGYPLWLWAVIAVITFLGIAYASAWSSAIKVGGNYKWIKEERNRSPTEVEKAYLALHLGGQKKAKGKMTLALGVNSSTLTLFRPNGTLFKVFSGYRPFWYKAEIQEIDSVTGAVILDSRGFTWEYEYIRIINGYANLKIIQYDQDHQFIKKWLYTVDAPVVTKTLDGVIPGVRKETPYTAADPGMKQ